jgi:hypothetical protein
MLNSVMAPLGAETQPVLGKCTDCGDVLPATGLRGPRKLRCAACAVIARRKGDLIRYHQRQGNVDVVSVGAEVPCCRCGETIRKTRADHVFCAPCLQQKANDYTREKREAARRAAGVRPRSGLTVQCDHCSAAFTSGSHNQIFCIRCRNQKSIRCNRKRRKNDPVFALNGMVSASIRKSLNGTKGARAWEALVGYTLGDLVRHLERQFGSGMTWDNRGAFWVIDHIQPIASFAITGPDCPEFRACWSLPNLRPLPADLNLKKSDKRLFLL